MFNTLDWVIVGTYCLGIICLATYVSRAKSGKERSAEDYFLAGRSLPWWAIGPSLIAANISAEANYRYVRTRLCCWYGYSSLGAYCCNCTYSNG
jgi:hypothetical protein